MSQNNLAKSGQLLTSDKIFASRKGWYYFSKTVMYLCKQNCFGEIHSYYWDLNQHLSVNEALPVSLRERNELFRARIYSRSSFSNLVPRTTSSPIYEEKVFLQTTVVRGGVAAIIYQRNRKSLKSFTITFVLTIYITKVELN